MAKKKSAKQPKKDKPGKFERFWNKLFTYSYDCDNPQTTFINETFFVILAIVYAWFCGLSVKTGSTVVVWIAIVALILGELYLLVSFFIGLTTFFLAWIRRRRRLKYGTEDYQAIPKEKKDRKKPKKRGYKISNRRF